MKILEHTVSSNLTNSESVYLRALLARGEPVFFDIETTGLSWRRSHVYLIGIIYRKEGRWTFRQWFLDRPYREDQCVDDFRRFLQERAHLAGQEGKRLLLVHYNGDTFDLPYLRNKLLFYHRDLSSGTSGHEAADASDPLPYESMDLYRTAMPLKKLYALPSLRQKDLEQLLGIGREDQMDGGQLITVYQEYIRSGSPDLERLLLLHNHDDVCGLFQLVRILSYQALFMQDRTDIKDPAIQMCGTDGSAEPPAVPEAVLRGSLSLPVPVSLQAASGPVTFSAEGTSFSLHIQTFQGEKKLFFPDYKNYFYLPLEDQAIHKSVAVYVDRDHREKAKASNCYQRVSGLFLPQEDALFTPVFRSGLHDRQLWFRPAEDFFESRELLTAYAAHLISHCLMEG